MHLTFCGAARGVTGSKYLLESGASRLLIDCGLFQGLKERRLRNWAPLPFASHSVNAVVLTHAHIDHTGYFPLLVKNGFVGKAFCSAGTSQLCKILLPDAGHLQEEEAAYANELGYSKHKPALPLYTEADAYRSLDRFASVPWGEKFEPVPPFLTSFSRAGHILGAACVKIRAEGKVIVFSGDLGRQDDLIMRPPEPIEHTDYLVIESTYGGKLHDKSNPLDHLAKVIRETVDRGGIILVPSFAVGRAQTLLYALYLLKKQKRIPDVPIYLNSPMAINVSKVFCDLHEDHKIPEAEFVEACAIAKYVQNSEESKGLNQRSSPMILIAASGMATGGRVLHHLKAFGPDPKSTILFAGYQAPGTRGAALVNGEKTVKIHGDAVPIHAEIANLESLSAHADQEGILKWLFQFKKPPRETFITHGEMAQSLALKKEIESQLGWKCRVPEYEERIEL